MNYAFQGCASDATWKYMSSFTELSLGKGWVKMGGGNCGREEDLYLKMLLQRHDCAGTEKSMKLKEISREGVCVERFELSRRSQEKKKDLDMWKSKSLRVKAEEGRNF